MADRPWWDMLGLTDLTRQSNRPIAPGPVGPQSFTGRLSSGQRFTATQEPLTPEQEQLFAQYNRTPQSVAPAPTLARPQAGSMQPAPFEGADLLAQYAQRAMAQGQQRDRQHLLPSSGPQDWYEGLRGTVDTLSKPLFGYNPDGIFDPQPQAESVGDFAGRVLPNSILKAVASAPTMAVNLPAGILRGGFTVQDNAAKVRELLALADQAERAGDTKTAMEARAEAKRVNDQSTEAMFGQGIMGAGAKIGGVAGGLVGGLTEPVGKLATGGLPAAGESLKNLALSDPAVPLSALAAAPAVHGAVRGTAEYMRSPEFQRAAQNVATAPLGVMLGAGGGGGMGPIKGKKYETPDPIPDEGYFLEGGQGPGDYGTHPPAVVSAFQEYAPYLVRRQRGDLQNNGDVARRNDIRKNTPVGSRVVVFDSNPETGVVTPKYGTVAEKPEMRGVGGSYERMVKVKFVKLDDGSTVGDQWYPLEGLIDPMFGKVMNPPEPIAPGPVAAPALSSKPAKKATTPAARFDLVDVIRDPKSGETREVVLQSGVTKAAAQKALKNYRSSNTAGPDSVSTVVMRAAGEKPAAPVAEKPAPTPEPNLPPPARPEWTADSRESLAEYLQTYSPLRASEGNPHAAAAAKALGNIAAADRAYRGATSSQNDAAPAVKEAQRLKAYNARNAALQEYSTARQKVNAWEKSNPGGQAAPIAPAEPVKSRAEMPEWQKEEAAFDAGIQEAGKNAPRGNDVNPNVPSNPRYAPSTPRRAQQAPAAPTGPVEPPTAQGGTTAPPTPETPVKTPETPPAGGPPKPPGDEPPAPPAGEGNLGDDAPKDAPEAPEGVWRRAYLKVMDLHRFSRSVRASGDLQGVYTQGSIISTTSPRIGARAFKESVRAAVSEKNAIGTTEGIDAKQERLYGDPDFYEKVGLDRTAYRPDDESAPKEDVYTSEMALKYPLVKASDRAYSVGLDKLRTDKFDQMFAPFKDHKDAEAIARDIARFVNVAGSRADIAKGSKTETYVKDLGEVLFSARYQLSRFQYATAHPLRKATTPEAKRLIAKEYATYIGAQAAFLSLAQASGLAEVETDPRSTDFLKAKIKGLPITIDTIGAQRSYYVLLARATGTTKDSKGKIVPSDFGTVAGNFGRDKLAPLPGAAINFYTGSDRGGNRTRDTVGQAAWQAGQLALPIGVGSLAEDVYKASGDPTKVAAATAAFTLSTVGVMTKPTRDAKGGKLPQFGLTRERGNSVGDARINEMLKRHERLFERR